MRTVVILRFVCANCGASTMEHAVEENGNFVFTGGCGHYEEVVLREPVTVPEVVR